MKLFVDTWGWVELSNARGARYREVRRSYQNFLRKNGVIYTSEYVLDETISLLFKRLPFDLANKPLNFIEQSIKNGELKLEWISQQRFEQTIKLRRKYKDKPRISFTDFTSMVVMRELGITDVMTEDDHFLHVGMGFNKVP